MLTKIATDFRKTLFSKANEVALFRALAESIVTHSSSTFIDETHGGNVCNVTFDSVTGKPETCEIADLLILCHAPGTPHLRATFWQAKKQAISRWLNVTADGSQLDFKGQFNQWDLLSRRPDIRGTGTFCPPSDLLSSFQSPSIGTFGVFYEKASTIEVAHSIAEFISCPTPAAKHPTLSINGYLGKYHFSHGEAISRLDLDSFLGALFNFEVGALLDSNCTAHRWLIQWVRTKVATKAGGEALRTLDGFLGPDDPIEAQEEPASDGLSILLVGAHNVA